jgi:hypothetical protein
VERIEADSRSLTGIDKPLDEVVRHAITSLIFVKREDALSHLLIIWSQHLITDSQTQTEVEPT